MRPLGITLVAHEPSNQPGFATKIVSERVRELDVYPPLEPDLDFDKSVIEICCFFFFIQTLEAQGIGVKFFRVDSGGVKISLNPEAVWARSGYMLWWKNRARRYGLTYEFNTTVMKKNTTLGLYSTRRVSLTPRAAFYPYDFSETVTHEGVHGAHDTGIREAGRTIFFASEDYNQKSKSGPLLPGAPAGYTDEMGSGEGEAQYIGVIKNDLSKRDVLWPEKEPFFRHVEWLRLLKRQFANQVIMGNFFIILVDGVRIRVRFPSPPGMMPTDAWIRKVLDTRIRHIENLIRIRTLSAARTPEERAELAAVRRRAREAEARERRLRPLSKRR